MDLPSYLVNEVLEGAAWHVRLHYHHMLRLVVEVHLLNRMNVGMLWVWPCLRGGREVWSFVRGGVVGGALFQLNQLTCLRS